MILGLQITGILFSLFMLYFALLHYKKGQLNGMEISSWVVIWTGAIFVILFPEIIRVYAESFAISRVLDLLIAGAFIVTFILVGSAYIRVKKLEKKIEELIRKLALKEKN